EQVQDSITSRNLNALFVGFKDRSWCSVGCRINDRRFPDFNRLSFNFQPAHWPWVESANAAFKLRCRKRPVNTRFFFTQLLGVSDKSFVLNFWFRRAVCQLFQRGDKPLWAKLCQLVVQRTTGIFCSNRAGELIEHITGV